MNSKNNEIQNLHGSLQEAIVSKDRVEQRVRQLLEVTQHSMPDETLQAQVQVKHRRASHGPQVLWRHVAQEVAWVG